MKPPSKRHPDILLHPPDELSSSRMASVLVHENRLLRARLEGRGRIEADPVLRRRLEEVTADNQQVTAQLDRTRGELDRSRAEQAELRRRLQSQNQQLPNIVNRVTGLSEQLGRHNDRLQQLANEIDDVQRRRVAVEQRAALEAELKDTVRRVEDLDSELERTRSELAQARSDIGRLLLRLRSTPLIHLLRRSEGFRAIESRWDYP